MCAVLLHAANRWAKHVANIAGFANIAELSLALADFTA
jgi:hypothetical protein